MGWTIFLGIVLVIFGSVLTFAPSAWWRLTESWKNDSATEPSDLYLKITRIGGIIFLMIGVAGIVLPFFLE